MLKVRLVIHTFIQNRKWKQVNKNKSGSLLDCYGCWKKDKKFIVTCLLCMANATSHSCELQWHKWFWEGCVTIRWCSTRVGPSCPCLWCYCLGGQSHPGKMMDHCGKNSCFGGNKAVETHEFSSTKNPKPYKVLGKSCWPSTARVPCLSVFSNMGPQPMQSAMKKLRWTIKFKCHGMLSNGILLLHDIGHPHSAN